jgi:hypothetical protein
MTVHEVIDQLRLIEACGARNWHVFVEEADAASLANMWCGPISPVTGSPTRTCHVGYIDKTNQRKSM